MPPLEVRLSKAAGLLVSSDSPIRRSQPSFEGVSALTRAMAQGDEEAFRVFFTSYAPRLYAYLMVVTRQDEALAQEALQQVMIRVGSKITAFSSEDYFWNWLAQIARRVVLDEQRKQIRWWRVLDRIAAGRPDDEKGISAAPGGEAQGAIHAALERLSDEDRLLVQKKYYSGFSVAELATDLGLTVKAIESRLVRIRKKLRAGLQKEGYGKNS